MTEGPILLRVQDACRKASDPPLGINFGRRLVAEGQWKSVRAGRRVLVIWSSVLDWIEREAAKNGNGAES